MSVMYRRVDRDTHVDCNMGSRFYCTDISVNTFLISCNFNGWQGYFSNIHFRYLATEIWGKPINAKVLADVKV